MSSLPASRAAPIAAKHPTAKTVPVMCFIVQAFLVLPDAFFRSGSFNSDQNCPRRHGPVGPKGGLGRDSGPGTGAGPSLRRVIRTVPGGLASLAGTAEGGDLGGALLQTGEQDVRVRYGGGVDVDADITGPGVGHQGGIE